MTAPAPAKDLDPAQTMVGTANGVGLWIGPEGTPMPKSGAPFTTPWRPLGYASDDGPTLGGETTSEAITPWQSRSPIRTIITEKTQTIAFVLWQLNQDTLGLYFSSEVPAATAAGEFEFDVRSDSAAKVFAIGLDVKDGDNQFRVGYTRATLDAAGDMQITKGAMVPLDVTLSALDDNGKLASVYVKAGGAPAGSGLLTVTASVDETGTADVVAEPTPVDAPAPDEAGVTTGPAAAASDTGTTTTTEGSADTTGTAPAASDGGTV